MKRTTIAVLGVFAFVVLAFLLVAAVNAPRVMEAEAHRQAAAAMQTQAQVTGLAVVTSMLLVIVLVAAWLVLTGLLAWATLTGRLNMAGRFTTEQPARHRRLAPRRRKQAKPVLPLYSASHPAYPLVTWPLTGVDETDELDIVWIEPDGNMWDGDNFFG